MVKIEQVADFFLEKDKAISQKELHQICYLAHIIYVGVYNNNLTEEDFFPMVTVPIAKTLLNLFIGINKPCFLIKRYSGIEKIEDNNIIGILEIVYDFYKTLDAKTLENLLKNSTPFLNARKELPYWASCTNLIDKNDIKYYGQNFVEELIENKILRIEIISNLEEKG